MIKTVVPAFLFAAILILSMSTIAPHKNIVGADGCDFSYGVENCQSDMSFAAN